MRVLVCGGRDFDDDALLISELDLLHSQWGFTAVIEGGARGADRMAGLWADTRMIPHRCFPADWKKHRSSAGPIRNQQMIDEGKPDMVVAFPGGKGTGDMIRRARAARLIIIQISAIV